MKTIVTAGKGGTGKSTILAGLLCEHILPNTNRNVLVVDADPHQSLTQLLASIFHFKPPTSLGELRRDYDTQLRTGKGLEHISRSELAELLVSKSLVQIPGGALLVMGGNEQAGCQCVVNSLLGQAIDALQGQFDLAIVDNEAGIEHIGRHHGWPVDVLLLMCTANALDLDVAHRILTHAQAVQREIRHSILVVNRLGRGINRGQIDLPETNQVATLPWSIHLEEMGQMGMGFRSGLLNLWSLLHAQIQRG